jgi:hypothetical protein
MMPASSKKGGTYFAMPDVCLTPAPPGSPVPVPYPNVAQVALTNGASTKVLIEHKETVVEGSKVPSSTGDEAGSSGGVSSGTNMGPVEPKQFSSKVFAEGKKVVFLTSTSAHNGSSPNQPLGRQVAPSQMRVLVKP